MFNKEIRLVFIATLMLFFGKAIESNVELNEVEHENDVEMLLASNVTRVNGGEPVKSHVPYQVSLQMYRYGQWNHFCSGSIITPNHIVTAAHCIQNLDMRNTSVLAGTVNRKYGGDRHWITAKTVHPEFSRNPNIINDIGILRVTPAFNFLKRTISTIKLNSQQRIGANVPVRLTGWGSTTSTGYSGLPEHLQSLEYITISNEDCFKSGFKVTHNELCAKAAKGQGACVGDSGGPLVTATATPQLVGIVSYGTAACAQGKPDVYARISSFLPYIHRVIKSETP